MKIINAKPPIYDMIIASGMRPHEGVVYAYGNTIYNPSGSSISEDVICHESIHGVQHGDNPESWWQRYLSDPHFRIAQEVEAYAAQYDYLCSTIKDKNARYQLVLRIAHTLSGPIYGEVISTAAALKMVKTKAKTK